MTKCVLLRLGWPDKALSPNASNRSHWGNKKRARDAAKAEAHAEAILRGANNLQGNKFTLKITGYLGPRMRGWDDDNLIAALKPHRDGIALAMGVDDKHFTCQFMGYERADKAGVIIEVWAE